ncbi:MAG: hypothetical protein H0T60_07900 [Acidobacteria bacterium]|nr:hypothetical protein [Acidobacteriota bacterium]
MRATRRRHRTPDPLASPEAIRLVCNQLRERVSETIPIPEKQLMRFLYSVRHVERHSATNTMRGRPGRWPREQLLEAASQLRDILERETEGRVSLNSFIGQYLPVIDFPSDVVEALSSGQINLQEAAQLARLTPERMQCSPAIARSQRQEILRSHLAVQGSQNRLRTLVKEILGENDTQAIMSENMASVVAQVDELLEIDPQDTRHLFWEEMKRIFYAMREVDQEDLDDEIMVQFLAAMDGVSNVLYRIEKRRRERQKQEKTGAQELR